MSEHEATLRVENHGKRDYFYAGDEYIGEVNKVSFSLGHDTGALIARSFNAHDTMPAQIAAVEAVLERWFTRMVELEGDESKQSIANSYQDHRREILDAIASGRGEAK